MRLGLIAGVGISWVMIWTCATDGYASLLVARAEKQPSLAAADRALALNRADADAHLLRAAVLEANGDLNSAVNEYQTATQLRPQDFVMWLSVARACELTRDRVKALAAARQALTLAPFYAQTHWQLGNMLVRDGQTKEGLAELRMSAAINSDFLPAVIDLAWQLSQGDVKFVEDAIAPQKVNEYVALAECFRRHGRPAEAVDMLVFAGPESPVRPRRALVNELIATKNFKQAYRLWSMGGSPESEQARAIVDAGFEHETNLDEPGFGWVAAPNTSSITRTLDPANPRQGRTSLRVDFNGDSDPNAPVISQLVLIDPHTHYGLRFAARAEEIVSGGLPVLRVIDANTGATLGEEKSISQTKEWRDYAIDFATGESTSAIQIVVTRNSCQTGPCPIFGRLWLDALTLPKSGT